MSRYPVWVLFLLFALIWFVNLGGRQIAEPDEGRYAEIPREMVASGDWVTPRLNGIKYFEKPALQYWATAAAYEVFGINAGSSRLYATTLAFLTVPLLFWLGLRLYGAETGLLAALMLGSSLMWAGVGHVNTLDIALAFWLTLALAAFLISQQPATSASAARRWLWLAWLAIALAVLQKGLVAIVLPGAAIVVYALLQRDARLLLRIRLLEGAAIVLVVAAPWFIVVSQRNPEFASFFFIHEHFTRFLTKVHKRDEPWWYFLPWLVLGLLPWLVPVWRSLRTSWAAQAGTAFHNARFLLIWPAVTLLFFSVSGSKLPPYIVPMLPPLLLLAAHWLVSRGSGAAAALRRGVLPLAAVVGALLVAAGAAVLMKLSPKIVVFADVAPFALLAGGTLICGVGLAHWRLGADRVVSGVAVLAFASLACTQLLLAGYDQPSVLRSSQQYAQIVRAASKPGAPLFFVGGYWQSLPFYLQRTGRLVQYQGELEFGIAQEPGLWIADLPQFASIWNRSPDAVAVVNPAIFDELESAAGRVKILFRDRRAVIIVHP